MIHALAHPHVGGRPTTRPMSTASIARALRAQAMPSSEIRAALSTGDPEMLHRLVELHEERLEERHAAQVRALREIERSLTAFLRRR